MGGAWKPGACGGGGVAISHKDHEDWGPADKFTVVLESAGLNASKRGSIVLALRKCSIGMELW